MVAVADDEREGRSERLSVPEAREHLDLVLLELLPRAAPVALAPACEVVVDGRAVELETCREPGEDGDERGSVRLAGGDELEHHERLPRNASMRSSAAERFSREFA